MSAGRGRLRGARDRVTPDRARVAEGARVADRARVAERARHAALAALLAVAACGFGGCASAEPTYFALLPSPGRPQTPAPRLVKLRRPGLAGYLDRSEVVRGVDGYHLQVLTSERWGEPLGDMIARVLAEDLTQRLPGTSVFTEAAAITADPDVVIEVDVQRFEAADRGDVVLAAQVVLERGRSHDAAIAKSLTFQRPANGAATADFVAAMSRLLGELADAIAGLLRAGTPAGPAGP